jgi:MoCo/4Fe-4S cofactor protein with predicted Tat translocation signal
MATEKKLDAATAQARLQGACGKQYWRSLEELADSEGFEELLHNEFPRQAGPLQSGQTGINRRDWLKLAGASLGLAGLSACVRMPTETIVPYVKQPEEIVPGKPLYFATTMPRGAYGLGLFVESHMGRPTKAEGNPLHPASLGASDGIAQASTLGLYDPDRSQAITHLGEVDSWVGVLAAVQLARAEQQIKKGAGLRLLTEAVGSPTLADQINGLLAQFPRAKWHQYEPANRDNARAGSKLAFGEYVETQYHFDQADVILALDTDFLCAGATSVRYAHDFAQRRRSLLAANDLNRLYVVEPTPSNTGSMADHRLRLRASEVEAFARALAAQLDIQTGAPPAIPAAATKWVPALAKDLQQHRGRSIVIAGDEQPPAVHALAHAMNAALENVGTTVVYTEPVEASPVDQTQSLADLVADLKAGAVDTLVVIGANPVYDAPVDFEFAQAIRKVKLAFHLGLYEDETSELCHWHIPAAHFLESWSDAHAHDGTVSIVQPLIAPLYDGRTAHELLAVFSGQPNRSSHDIVHDFWKATWKMKGGKDASAAQRSQGAAGNAASAEDKAFEDFWQKTLHDGVMAGTVFAPKTVRPSPGFGALPANPEPRTPNPAAEDGSLEIVFRVDPAIGDGRYANSGWLQELPKPLTRLTWDNVALISPSTAKKLQIDFHDAPSTTPAGELVELSYLGRKVVAPVWIMPGQADDSVAVHLGYGRWRAGRVGNGVGFNAYALRTSDALWSGDGLTIRKVGENVPLASTQEHHLIDGNGKKVDEESHAEEPRELLRVGTLDDFKKNPEFAKGEEVPRDLSMYPGYTYEGLSWGMTIDLNSCTGCGACVVACQSENNIPVVGKEEVGRGREMHWIRVDRYYRGDAEAPEAYHEPVPCMQCENAPCELVCPVGATSHSQEGINQMVYNRCVGTRYCSNNCPYKVRRFNFFQFSDYATPSLKLLNNPNVTVRSRGVMEKCTYCIQRINAVKIPAEIAERTIEDGDITPACAQSCPTQAIVFGNINDPNSRVAKLKQDPRHYGLLTELNTRPRTTYLARLRNPNPEI